MMKYSHRVSDGVHVLSYVYLHQDTKISSARLASSIDSNPSLVRRLMSRLTKAGLLVTHPGTASPALAKEPEEITLLDVYRAVEDQYHLLHIDEQTNPDCPIGKNIQGVLTQEFAKVQAAAEAAMPEITLAEITANLQERIEG